MENLNLDEAMCSIFQEGCWKKYFILFGIYFLLSIFMLFGIILIIIGLISSKDTYLFIFGLLGFGIIFVSIIGSVLTKIFINGYFMLYSQDIAHDKNARIRPITKETIKEGLIAGLKNIIAGFVMLPFTLFLLIISIVVIIAAFVLKLKIWGILITICLLSIGLFAGLLLITIPITKITSYFIKDMNVASLFHWGKAFEYTKGIKDTIWVAVIPGFAYGLVFIALYIIPMGTLFAPLAAIIYYAFYYNLLGQYTYSAINKKREDENGEYT